MIEIRAVTGVPGRPSYKRDDEPRPAVRRSRVHRAVLRAVDALGGARLGPFKNEQSAKVRRRTLEVEIVLLGGRPDLRVVRRGLHVYVVGRDED